MITNSTDDTIIQYINDVMLIEGSQDNILTSVDNITLQSDMIYTIQVSFSNMDGEFNITSNKNFSKWMDHLNCNYTRIIKNIFNKNERRYIDVKTHKACEQGWEADVGPKIKQTTSI